MYYYSCVYFECGFYVFLGPIYDRLWTALPRVFKKEKWATSIITSCPSGHGRVGGGAGRTGTVFRSGSLNVSTFVLLFFEEKSSVVQIVSVVRRNLENEITHTFLKSDFEQRVVI